MRGQAEVQPQDPSRCCENPLARAHPWETRSLRCLLTLLGKQGSLTRSTPCYSRISTSQKLQAAHMPRVVTHSHVRAEQAWQGGPCSVSVQSDASGNISSALLTSSPQSHPHPSRAIHRFPKPPLRSQSHPQPARGIGVPLEPSISPRAICMP